MIPNNNVFKNYLHVDFQKMLQPLHILQCLYFHPKFTMKDHFLKPNCMKLKIFCACVILIAKFLDLYRSFTIAIRLGYSKADHIMYITENIYYAIGFYLSYKVNVWDSEKNLKFVIDLQRSTIATEISNNRKHILHKTTISNWLAFIFLSFFHILMYIVIFMIHPYNIVLLIVVYAFESFDIHIVYATQITKFIRINIEDLISQINSSGFGRRSKLKKHCDKKWKDIFHKYSKLLNNFQMHRKDLEGLVST